MTALPASVVVVSRGRAGALTLCLEGLVQQDHPDFEIIVVADVPGLKSVRDWEEASSRRNQIKTIAFDEPNISVARNLGVAQAAGEVVAFIDDDAVAEPTWLRRLCAPFQDGENIVSSGGYVRGRNGISYQWQAHSVDRTGETVPLDLAELHPVALSPSKDRAIKTEGTNMAFRRDVLAQIGGFDPAYHYYLDETDVNLRIAKRGGETAIVPLAEVHHGYLANATRTAGRVPSDLTQIGASLAVFLRRHCPEHQRDATRARVRKDQRKRLIRHMVNGPLDPLKIGVILRSFDQGYAAGLKRKLGPLPTLPRATRPFEPIPPFVKGEPVLLSGRFWQRRALAQRAREAVSNGRHTTVIRLSPSALYHRVRFTREGYWEHKGGLFGRSDRNGYVFQFWTFARRIAAEQQRIGKQRGYLR